MKHRLHTYPHTHLWMQTCPVVRVDVGLTAVLDTPLPLSPSFSPTTLPLPRSPASHPTPRRARIPRLRPLRAVLRSLHRRCLWRMGPAPRLSPRGRPAHRRVRASAPRAGPLQPPALRPRQHEHGKVRCRSIRRCRSAYAHGESVSTHHHIVVCIYVCLPAIYPTDLLCLVVCALMAVWW